MALKDAPPAFQLYAADELADSDLALAGPAVKGVYLDLRCYCWRDGTIPADPSKLARLARLTPARFAPIWALLRCRFTPAPTADSGDGAPQRLVHLPLEDQRAKMDARKLAQSNRAKARWSDHAAALPAQVPTDSRGTAGADADSVQALQCSSSSSSTSLKADTHTAGARALGPAQALALTGTDLVDACRSLVTAPGRAGVMGGDLLAAELADMSRRTAAAQDPPVDPAQYARLVCDAFAAFRASCSPATLPSWRADALRLHWDRLERIVAGTDPWPQPWGSQAARALTTAPRNGARQRVPVARDRGPVGSGAGGAA